MTEPAATPEPAQGPPPRSRPRFVAFLLAASCVLAVLGGMMEYRSALPFAIGSVGRALGWSSRPADADVSYVSTLTELEEAESFRKHGGLQVVLPWITASTATRIARIRKPASLHFAHSRIEDTAPLAESAELRILRLEDVRLAPAGIRGMARLGQVTRVELIRVGMEAELLVDFLPPGLRELSVEGMPVRELTIRLAHRLPHLRSLSISNPIDAGPVDFSPLTELTALEHLDLRGCPVGDVDLAGLAALQSLRRIDLSGTRVTDAVCERLGQLPSLESVKLSETAITDAACERLGRIPSLNGIDLSKTAVTVEGVEPLLRLPFLARLILRGAPVGKLPPIGREILPRVLGNGWVEDIELDRPGIVLTFCDPSGIRILTIEMGP